MDVENSFGVNIIRFDPLTQKKFWSKPIDSIWPKWFAVIFWHLCFMAQYGVKIQYNIFQVLRQQAKNSEWCSPFFFGSTNDVRLCESLGLGPRFVCLWAWAFQPISNPSLWQKKSKATYLVETQYTIRYFNQLIFRPKKNQLI